MAITATTVWEVRTDGSDTNAGAYNASRSGATTDYTYPTSTVFAYTDLASTNGNNAAAAITSATRAFTSADVGNHIRISSGTNWTVGVYEIISVSGGAATLDRAVGTAATISGGNGRLGGALASPGLASASLVAGNTVYFKKGTYDQSSSSVRVSGGVFQSGVSGTATLPIFIIGYKSTRDDNPGIGDRPAIRARSAAGIYSVSVFNSPVFGVVKNISVQNPDGVNVNGLFGGTTNNSRIVDCDADGFNFSSANYGIRVTGIAERCQVTNCGQGYNFNRNGGHIINCTASGCTSSVNMTGQSGNAVNNATRCLFVGGICDVARETAVCNYIECTLAGGASFLEANAATVPFPAIVTRCVQWGSSGYGADSALATTIPWIMYRFNAFGGNTSGNYNPLITTSGTRQRAFDTITLTLDPFVDSANGDYRLNGDGGGGAAVRGVALPVGALPIASYPDYGAVQSQPLVYSAFTEGGLL